MSCLLCQNAGLISNVSHFHPLFAYSAMTILSVDLQAVRESE